MITWPEQLRVYLHRAPVDFRKQINGLSVLVQEAMELDPFGAALYVFTNRRCDRVKILYWDKNGFCLWLKRLERDRFVWPHLDEREVVELSGEQLSWLLAGFDIFRFPPHQQLNYGAVS